MQLAKFSIDGEQYEFDMAKLSLFEAKELEAKSGMNVLEWQKALSEMSAEAVAALAWLAARRMGKPFACKYSELDFDLLAMGQSLELESDEPDPTKAANRAARRSTKKSSPTPQ